MTACAEQEARITVGVLSRGLAGSELPEFFLV